MTPVTAEKERPTLAELADQGQDALLAELYRILPDTDSGQVPVAAFNSSI